MLNKYPLWKYLLVLFVAAMGVVYALPNLYPPDAAVQITPAKSGDAVDEYTLNKALKTLEEGKEIGRKLDFLCQEMHREVNTISSKVSQMEISKHTLGMKQAIERLRQQIQNIE